MCCHSPDLRIPSTSCGFTLLEMMIGVFLSTLLITAVVQLLSGSLEAYRLQLEKSRMEESSRYARDVLVSHISGAGYHPQPWVETPALPALTTDAMDGAGGGPDQLGFQRWSRVNCFGNENPVTDDDGRGKYYLLRTRFSINSSNNLAMTCQYGADAATLVTQVRNYGVVENIVSMQAMYAEDTNGDSVAERWVSAAAWQSEGQILAVKVGLLFSSNKPFAQATASPVNLLDETIKTGNDGRLLKVSHVVSAIRGRLQ
jgi:type IV pilus assembly protein PilW